MKKYTKTELNGLRKSQLIAIIQEHQKIAALEAVKTSGRFVSSSVKAAGNGIAGGLHFVARTLESK